jgi:3-dehydroquinate synthase
MHKSKKHIFLIGPSGVGKTTVGELVARKLGFKFLDLDAEISSRISMSISDFFSDKGEAAFRVIEKEVLEDISKSEEPTVIATGAGSVLDALNIATMKSKGTVILLNAQVKDILSRIENDLNNARPLLKTDLEKNISNQYRTRIDVYNIAQDISIGTSNREVDAVVDAVVRQYERANGATSDIGSQIIVGEHLIADIAALAKTYSSALVITQENIPFRDFFQSEFEKAGVKYNEIIVADGEEAKSFSSYESVLNQIAGFKANRSSCVIALGGGVVGDLTGFVGSTYMRGIDVIQVPTTLLAQVDSSIGGKCGINISAGKNMIGTITQPKVIFSDIGYIKSLPDADYISGLGEVAKYALLGNLTVRELIEEQSDQILARDVEVLGALIRSCMNHKVHIVSRDPFERNGMRATLNLGHTLAHVIEKVTDFKFAHGQAVAIGIRYICDLSLELETISREQYDDHLAILDLLGLGNSIPNEMRDTPANELVDLMYSDKKSDGTLNLVLFKSEGGVELVADVDREIAAKVLDSFKSRQ